MVDALLDDDASPQLKSTVSIAYSALTLRFLWNG